MAATPQPPAPGFMGRVLAGGELVIPLTFVVVVIVMVIPLPTVLLDLLLTVNIAVSLIILLVAMYTLKPLEFSTFPSVLLVTTLLRLSLNVASTRLILLHGQEGSNAAGHVIQAFGSFVVGGSYVVGLVIFLILVVINFVVITKGAGRIAEVAARFTLDAMPGKQLAVDAELNAGGITEREARERRRSIEAEADFYGAMDGASKFVRGDAIAAVVITLVNILGGLTIGVLQQGMTMAAAAQTYTLLTVGEGLVAQLPALIVSTAAGIVITRAASEVDLGFEITRQVLISPKAVGTAAGILLALGLVPGLPHLAFLALGGMTAWMAYQLNDQQKTSEVSPSQTTPQVKAEDAGTQVVPLDLMEVQVGYGLINLVDGGRGGGLLDRIKGLRRQFAEQMGFVLPPIHIRDNLQLRPNEYAALLKGVELAKSEVMPAHVLAIDPGTAQRGIIHGLSTKEPAFGLPAMWVPEQEHERAQMAGYTVVDPGSAIATHLSELIKRHAHELLGRQEVQGLLDQLGKNHPKLVEEVIPNLIPLGTLVRVLSHLLREGVPIRDLRSILETIADHAPTTKDPDILTEVARQALGRTITRQYLASDGSLPIIGLDPRLDRTLADQANSTPQGTQWIPDPQVAQKLLAALKLAAERMVGRGHQPVILCSPSLRRHLRKLTDRILHSVPILGLNEVDSVVRLQAMETVRLDLEVGETRSLA